MSQFKDNGVKMTRHYVYEARKEIGHCVFLLSGFFGRTLTSWLGMSKEAFRKRSSVLSVGYMVRTDGGTRKKGVALG